MAEVILSNIDMYFRSEEYIGLFDNFRVSALDRTTDKLDNKQYSSTPNCPQDCSSIRL
jgi:hypothetical protein